MGVAGFFAWLQRKYPKIVVKAIEQGRTSDGRNLPVDATQPNPNFQEFDNLYLDLNAIIHPCTHPEDRPAPKTEEEMFIVLFEHLDRLFNMVRPRKLVYMAIDGVAPRAKMNQQRSRRFRSSKEASDKQKMVQLIRQKLESQGIPLPPPNHFDPNCITPGTPFMARLTVALRYYVHLRVTNDPAWQNLTVILSDSNVPGEGEHKIIEYIRQQRLSPNYNPNTAHCVCGVDADLIMLGLATHEVNFTILREEFLMDQPRPCELCQQFGHNLSNCNGSKTNGSQLTVKQKDFLFVRLSVLRGYLDRDFYSLGLPFEFDLERVVDDWIFLCFFVGNDFLPHLPSLEIYEGAINRLVTIYRELSHKLGGWLTENGDVRLDRVEMIMVELGRVEDEIFRVRRTDELAFQEEQKRRRQSEPVKITDKRLRPAGRKRSLTLDDGDEPKAKLSKISSPDKCNAEDNIRFWEEGWKDRYYKEKFDTPASDVEFRHKVAWAYTEGLCWVFKYYCHGCPSWDWYYPYHYAPFASDFDTISQFKPDWSKPTKPFRPLEQLMAVFPAASQSHIPSGWRSLMTSPESPIFDFYPTEFKIDLIGKKFSSQGVALLPFVDEKLLIKTLDDVYHTLSEDEKLRNSTGPNRLFVGKRHPLFQALVGVYNAGKQGNGLKRWLPIDLRLASGMSGDVRYDPTAHEPNTCLRTLFPGSDKFTDVNANDCIMVAHKSGISTFGKFSRPPRAVLRELN